MFKHLEKTIHIHRDGRSAIGQFNQDLSSLDNPSKMEIFA
jgi:hypothetical protein